MLLMGCSRRRGGNLKMALERSDAVTIRSVN